MSLYHTIINNDNNRPTQFCNHSVTLTNVFDCNIV